MKKVIALVICLAFMLSLAACGSREAIDPETFRDAAEEAGFIVTYFTEANMPEGNDYTNAVMCQSGDANAQLLVFKSETEAKKSYASAVSATKNDNVVVEKEVSSATYAKYYVSNGDEYIAICRIGNSIFYGKEDDNNGMVRDLIEKIGY